MKRPISICLAVVLIAGTLFACGKRPAGQSAPTTVESEEITTPAIQPPEPDLADYPAQCRERLDGIAMSDASDLAWTETNGTVTVTGYLGSAAGVRIPDSIAGCPVTAVGDGAFADQTALTALWIPDSVTGFGSGILSGCTALEALHTPFPTGEGKNFFGYLYGAEEAKQNNTEALRALRWLEIGGTPTEIPDEAFFDCNDLLCILLPKTVTRIGDYSFYQCASLRALSTERLTEVGTHALEGCRTLQKVVFGEGLRSVGFAALRDCDLLLSLTLPFVGQSSEENRFLGYLFGAASPSLARGFYPPFLQELVLLPGCASLADQAISDCVSLQTVVIPEGLTTVGARTFSGCTALETVSFPASLRTIGEGAFSGCSVLTGITFSEGLTGIGMNAFYGCRSLVDVTLPQTLTALPPSCFAACRSLARVDLGGVLTVEKDCFADCPSISSVRGLDRQGMTVKTGNEAILVAATEKS